MSTPGKTIECLFGNQKEACWSRHLAMPATFVYISQTCIFFVGMGTKIERSGGRPCFCVRMMQTIFFKQRERSHRNCFRKFSIWKLFCANSNVMGPQSSSILFIRVFHETFQLLGYHVVYRTICAMGLKPGLP